MRTRYEACHHHSLIFLLLSVLGPWPLHHVRHLSILLAPSLHQKNPKRRPNPAIQQRGCFVLKVHIVTSPNVGCKQNYPSSNSSEEHDAIAKNWYACFLCKFNIWRRTTWKLKYLGGTNVVATLLVNLCEIMFHWSTCFRCLCVCVIICIQWTYMCHPSKAPTTVIFSFLATPRARPLKHWWGWTKSWSQRCTAGWCAKSFLGNPMAYL